MSKSRKLIYLVVAITILIIIAIIGFFIINKKIFQDTKISIADYKYFVLYSKNDKVGVIDRNGNTILDSTYTDVYIPNPLKDVFICFDGDSSSIVNSKGEKIFENYKDISALVTSESSLLDLEKNVLRHKKDGLYGLINLDGEVVADPIYEEISSLKNRPGRILVKKDEKYGVLDSNGKVVVPVSYYSIVGDEYCED